MRDLIAATLFLSMCFVLWFVLTVVSGCDETGTDTYYIDSMPGTQITRSLDCEMNVACYSVGDNLSCVVAPAVADLCE